MDDGRFTHAGGLVVRTRDGRPEIVVIRPSDGSDAWVLPKGHIEPGEQPEQAAVREVEEEAGVRAAQGDDDDARYQIVETELPDRTRAGAVAPVDLAFPNLRIFVSGEEQELELYEWFKLAEVVATGIHPPFVLADDYCPPLLAVQAFAPLRDQIEKMAAALQDRIEQSG